MKGYLLSFLFHFPYLSMTNFLTWCSDYFFMSSETTEMQLYSWRLINWLIGVLFLCKSRVESQRRFVCPFNLARGLPLARLLLNQGLLVVMLKPSLRTFHCRHDDVATVTLLNAWVTYGQGYVPFAIGLHNPFPLYNRSWVIIEYDIWLDCQHK